MMLSDIAALHSWAGMQKGVSFTNHMVQHHSLFRQQNKTKKKHK